MKGISLQDFLDTRGYLTINQLVKYLQEYHPLRAVSYPTLKRFFDKGYFTYTRVGGQNRIEKESIERYCKYGTMSDEEIGRAQDGALPLSPKEVVPEPETSELVIPILENRNE
jgi:hypothetical protein